MATDFSYDAWAATDMSNWGELSHARPAEQDCHVDLGCGTLKKGRIGIDRYAAPGVNIVMDLETLQLKSIATAPNLDAPEPTGWQYPEPWRLPFAEGSIRSVVSHHCLEHIGAGFVRLVDEVYRVLEPGGTFAAITPLFPSTAAVADPDHCRYFMEGTWDVFCGHLGDENNPTGCWLDSFSVPYTKSRFTMLDKDMTPAVPLEEQWGRGDIREIRVILEACK